MPLSYGKMLAFAGLLLSLALSIPAEPTSATTAPAEKLPPPKPGILPSQEIRDFAKNSLPVQQLLLVALDLAAKRLDYKMGSADPKNGAMDCSGTMYYLLRTGGFTDIPRQSDQQYRWVWEAGTFIPVNGTREKTFELSKLRPGHLLFWSGTYNVGDRDPPVSHVMIYLGKRISDGKAIMFGASNGRTYDGKASWGVGIFDFRLPAQKGSSRFIGYAAIPGLNYDAPPEPQLKPAEPPPSPEPSTNEVTAPQSETPHALESKPGT